MEIELGVPQAVPSWEPWLETPPQARSSELGIPVANREGTTGINDHKD